jgi:hypothetical protein
MNTWFKVAINGGEGYMLLTDGEFVGYYDLTGAPMLAHEGTSVHVTENDVTGPF